MFWPVKLKERDHLKEKLSVGWKILFIKFVEIECDDVALRLRDLK
jgi:hypothetical protein